MNDVKEYCKKGVNQKSNNSFTSTSNALANRLTVFKFANDSKTRKYIVGSGLYTNDGGRDMFVDFGQDYSQPNTIIIVHTKNDGSMGNYVFDGSLGSKRHGVFGAYNMFAGASANTLGSFNPNIPYMAGSIFKTTMADFFYNQTQRTGSNRNCGNQVMNEIRFGARFYAASRIQHDAYKMAVFDGIVSASEIEQLRQRMASKHSITLS